MPIFDYQCNKCQNIQEVITTSVSETPILKCDKCQSEDMHKLLSGVVGFELKGECWAKDGYQYEYLKSQAGEPRQYPVYGRKGVQEKLKTVRDSMK